MSAEQLIRAPEKSSLPWHYVALVAFPIAALLASEFLIAALDPRPATETFLVCADAAKQATTQWSEAAARIQVLAMVLIFFPFAVVAVVKFAVDLFTLFCTVTRSKLIVAYATCVLVGSLVIWSALCSGWLPRSKDFLGAQVFADSLGIAAKYEQKWWGENAFEILLYATNAVTLLAVPAFIVGGISCLAVFVGCLARDNLILQTERLKTNLYMSAGFLVVGVLYFKAWTGYPSFCLTEAQAKAFANAANAYTMYTGIEYSIILAAYALPVAWILSSRARERIDKAIFSARESVQIVIALLAPFITGALPSLTSALGS